MSTASNTLAGHQSSIRDASSWPRETGNLSPSTFRLSKLEERVATLIQRKPALPALRKLSPRNLKAWANPEFVQQRPAQIETSSAW
jgi:hypothetical protein